LHSKFGAWVQPLGGAVRHRNSMTMRSLATRAVRQAVSGVNSDNKDVGFSRLAVLIEIRSHEN
jgi:hypothetical protein